MSVSVKINLKLKACQGIANLSIYRKTTSQSPNEVIDHMIERNGNKLQELESLSLNTLQGFYVIFKKLLLNNLYKQIYQYYFSILFLSK